MLQIGNGLFPAALISRLIFGAGFLFSVVYNQQFSIAIAQMAVALILLRLLDGNMQRILRALRLMLWIVLPMVLVHALFSPGRLIELAWITISFDGALFGGWLAIHFITIFMAALLLFQMIDIDEWFLLILRIPLLRSRLLPYIVLLQPLRSESMNIISRFRYRWQRGKKGLGRLSVIIFLVMRSVINAGSAEAGRIWNNWDHEVNAILHRMPEKQTVSLLWSIFWPTFAAVWIWLAVTGAK